MVLYSMEDTLSHGTSSTGRWFSISTKMVKNGHLKEVITWNYSKYKTVAYTPFDGHYKRMVK